MKILLVGSTFPPDRCGVGDHSRKLLTSLRELGHEVTHRRALPTGASEIKSVLCDVDAILLQYTPNLWSQNKLRIAPGLARRVRHLRNAGARVYVIAHELHYPVHFSARGLLLGWTQRLQFRRVARAADWVFFTYAAARGSVESRVSDVYRRSEVLPVGSNIEMAASPVEKTVRGPGPHLVHFGGDHPTHLLEWTVRAFDRVLSSSGGSNATLTWVGLGGSERDRILARIGRGDLREKITAPGYLSEGEVSAALRGATVVLAPFMDGVSTRRGSVMAALEHGVPVVTTLGWASDPTIPWSEFCRVSRLNGNPEPRAADAETFVDEVILMLSDPTALRALGQRGRAHYEREFSWARIARALSDRLRNTEPNL